jgi:hypothetical protein
MYIAFYFYTKDLPWTRFADYLMQKNPGKLLTSRKAFIELRIKYNSHFESNFTDPNFPFVSISKHIHELCNERKLNLDKVIDSKGYQDIDYDYLMRLIPANHSMHGDISQHQSTQQQSKFPRHHVPNFTFLA